MSLLRSLVLQRWLEIVALLHILGGCLLVFGFPANLFNTYLDSLFVIFKANSTPEGKEIVATIIRLFGATIGSWGILMFYLVQRVALHKDGAAKACLIIATCFWFFLDTGLSASQGIYAHVYLNSAAFLSIVLPLLLLNRVRSNSN